MLMCENARRPPEVVCARVSDDCHLVNSCFKLLLIRMAAALVGRATISGAALNNSLTNLP